MFCEAKITMQTFDARERLAQNGDARALVRRMRTLCFDDYSDGLLVEI